MTHLVLVMLAWRMHDMLVAISCFLVYVWLVAGDQRAGSLLLSHASLVKCCTYLGHGAALVNMRHLGLLY